MKSENAQGEYYLTDLIGIAVGEGRRVAGVRVADSREMLGVNSRRDLAEVDAILRRRAADAALDAGATLVRPETITLDEAIVLLEARAAQVGNTPRGKKPAKKPAAPKAVKEPKAKGKTKAIVDDTPEIGDEAGALKAAKAAAISASARKKPAAKKAPAKKAAAPKKPAKVTAAD